MILAKQNGISSKLFRQRVNLGGWDYERASIEPVRNKSENIKIVAQMRRKYPKHIVELAKKNGVCYETFKYRVYAGWTLEDASEIKVRR